MWDGKCPERSSYEDEDINLYLKMEGLTPSLMPLEELRGVRRGLTLTGEEAYEGLNELERAPRLTTQELRKTT